LQHMVQRARKKMREEKRSAHKAMKEMDKLPEEIQNTMKLITSLCRNTPRSVLKKIERKFRDQEKNTSLSAKKCLGTSKSGRSSLTREQDDGNRDSLDCDSDSEWVDKKVSFLEDEASTEDSDDQAGALKDRHSLNKRYTKAKLSTRKSKDVPCDQTKNENNDNRMERSYEIGDLVEVYSSTHREYLPGMITKVLESEGKICATYLHCPGRKHLHAKSGKIRHLKRSKTNAFGKCSSFLKDVLDSRVPAKVVESILVNENDVAQRELSKFQRFTILKTQSHFPVVKILHRKSENKE